jgi:uncharacterized membrane protein
MSQSHQFIVHFPIALIISAFLFTLIGLFFRRGLFKELIFWNLVFGLLASGLAIYTGLQEETGLLSTSKQANEAMEVHKRSAYIICGFIFALTVWMGMRKREMRLLEYMAWSAFLMIGSVGIALQGYSGTQMGLGEEKETRYNLQQIDKLPAKVRPEEDIF